jgi:hypothetical protein
MNKEKAFIMKSIFRFTAAFLFFSGSLFYSGQLHAQNTDRSSKIAVQIESKQFTFVARSVKPFRGSLRFLNDPYDVIVRPDSVISYLPFFGESQSAPMSSSDGGIKFTSTKFDYKFEKGKKDRWNIEINFQDQDATRKFNFTIFDNGKASLDVTSTYRDPISFDGEIKK